MLLDKKTFRMIMLLLLAIALFWWGANNIVIVFGFIAKIFNILKPLFLGMFLAYFINVIMRKLEELWGRIKAEKRAALMQRLKRPVCMIASLIIVFGVFALVILLLAPEFVSAVNTLAEKVPGYALQLELWWNALAERMLGYGIDLPELLLDQEKILAAAAGIVSRWGGAAIDQTLGFTGSLISGFTNAFVTLVFAIYFLYGKEKFGAGLKRILTAFLPARQLNSVLSFGALVDKSFSSFITGQLTEVVILAGLCFAGMTVFGMPYAPVVSALIGVTALIPMVGALLGTSIGAFLILLDSPIMALWFVIYIVIMQQIDNNFIYPRVVGKSVGLPPLFVLMAISIGGKISGLFGMLIGVPTMSVIYTLVTHWVEKRLNEKKILDINKV